MLSCIFGTGLILSIVFYAEARTRCPYQYHLLHDRLCYKLGRNRVVWTDANRECSKDDGVLFRAKSHNDIDDLRQIANVLRLTSGTAYLGLIDPGDGSGYANDDRTSIKNPFWVNGKTPIPQQFGDPRCGYISFPGDGRWNSSPCGIKRQYICVFVPYDVRNRNKKRKRIRCHVCTNAETNEECNRKGTQLCPFNAESCQNEVRVFNGRKRISKRCKQTRACENNYLQNSRAIWLEAQCKPGRKGSSVCRCCCKGDECNAFELPCLARGCTPLSVPKDGQVVCTDEYMLGSLCIFTCDIGFSISGSEATRCTGLDGKWTSPVPECVRTQCFPPKTAPTDGHVTCSDENYGSSLCRFSCKYGHYLKGLSLSTCLQTGDWSVDSPTCEKIQCPTLEAPINGKFEVKSSVDFGSVTSFSCNEKYFLIGSASTRCTDRNLDGIGDWTNQPPQCKLITCSPSLSPIANGKLVVSTETNEVGTIATFECREGFVLQGNGRLTCEGPTTDGFGKWSDEPPRCKAIMCPDVPHPPNGREVVSTSAIPKYGTVLTFACDFGYFLVGNTRSQCGDEDGDGEGEWTNPPPVCEDILCPSSVRAPENGRIVENGGVKLGDSIEFDCNEGFFLVGQPTITCVDEDDAGEGEWDHAPPTCEQIECTPMLEPPNNGDMLCTEENDIGTSCKFSCNHGFFLSGAVRTSCVDEDSDGVGEWTHPVPECIQILCRNTLNAPGNGRMECSDGNFFGSLCEFTCYGGFWMIGNKISACENDGRSSDGVWSNETPICQEIVCDNSQTPPEFGSVFCTDSQRFGSDCTYTCIKGYHLIGKDTTTCRDLDNDGKGEWSNEKPICTQSICSPKQDKIKFGAVTCTNENSYGATCNFQCKAGYKMIGKNSISCGEPRKELRATWSSNPPTCQKRFCSEVTSSANGNVICSDGWALGSRCTYSCKGKKYFMIGDDVISCITISEAAESDVRWDKPAPTCELITCPKIRLKSKQVTIDCTDSRLSLGTTCAFDCIEGYILVGSGEVECGGPTEQTNGKWSRDSPTCKKIKCRPPSFPPTNGTVQCSEENLFGSSCEYSCEVGYEARGERKRKCLADGSWSSLAPVCEKMRCDPAIGQLENGVRACTEENYFGSICLFFCDTGYTLEGAAQSRCTRDRDGNVAFDNPSPTCKPIYCRMISGPVNGGRVVCGIGQETIESNRYGTTCYLSCREGWKMRGNPRTTCLGQGTWTKKLGMCERVTCSPPLAKPERGQMSCSDDDNIPGTKCTFSCTGKLKLNGNDEVTCTDGGIWSDKPPLCVSP